MFGRWCCLFHHGALLNPVHKWRQDADMTLCGRCMWEHPGCLSSMRACMRRKPPVCHGSAGAPTARACMGVQVADNMAEALIALVNLGQLAWRATEPHQETRARMERARSLRQPGTNGCVLPRVVGGFGGSTPVEALRLRACPPVACKKPGPAQGRPVWHSCASRRCWLSWGLSAAGSTARWLCGMRHMAGVCCLPLHRYVALTVDGGAAKDAGDAMHERNRSDAACEKARCPSNEESLSCLALWLACFENLLDTGSSPFPAGPAACDCLEQGCRGWRPCHARQVQRGCVAHPCLSNRLHGCHAALKRMRSASVGVGSPVQALSHSAWQGWWSRLAEPGEVVSSSMWRDCLPAHASRR